MSGERSRRLRVAVADNQALLALALVAVVVAGGVLAGTAYVAPGTTTEERVTSSWHRTSTFSHAATVTRSAGVFEPGRHLRNRSIYFVRASPRLNATYAAGYDGTTGFEASTEGDVDVAVRLGLVRRAVADGETLWRTERVLAERNATDVRPGEPVTVPASVNVSAARARTRQLVDRLGASPGATETLLVADVRLAGTVDGRRAARSFTHEVGLSVSGGTYRVTGAHRSTSSPVESRTTVETERSYGPLYRVGGPAAVAVGLVGFVGLAWGRLRGTFAVSDAERAWLDYRRDRAEFDDWVHDVDPPAEAAERPRATAASLGDLVDLAIDVDAAVLSPDDRTYVVVHDGYRYVYEAPPDPAGAGPGRRRALGAGDADEGKATDADEGEATDAGGESATDARGGDATDAGGTATDAGGDATDAGGTATDAGGDDAIDAGGETATDAGEAATDAGEDETVAADADAGGSGGRPDQPWGDVAEWPDGLDASAASWTDGLEFPVELDDAAGLEFPDDGDDRDDRDGRDGPF